MNEQNVPRDKISRGIDLEIYKRCGWVPPKEGASEQEELNLRMKDVSNNVGNKALSILEKNCTNYEKRYMSEILS